MKIGWARLSMLIELDFNLAKVGYTEMRTGFVKALLNNGHKVKFLTNFTKDTKRTWESLQENKDYSTGVIDISWIRKVGYEPNGTAEDCDLLIVECSAGNFMFQSDGKPQMRRIPEILNTYKGLVIVEQSDPDLPFPFAKYALTKYPWSHKQNPYRLDKAKGVENLEEYGWADSEEIFDNKEYVVLVKSSAIAMTMDTMNGTRFGYKRCYDDGLINVVYAPQAYDSEYTQDLEFNYEPAFDIVYAGYPRDRENRFKDVLFNMPKWLSKAVIGPWKKKKNLDLAEQLPFNYIHNEGYVTWANVSSFINNSKASLYLGAPRSYKLQWETSRPFEAVFSKSILFYDAEGYLSNVFGSEFNLQNFKDNESVCKFLREVTVEERLDIHKSQLKSIRHRDWNWFLNYIETEINLIIKNKIALVNKNHRTKLNGKAKHPKSNLIELVDKYNETDTEKYKPDLEYNKNIFHAYIKKNFEAYDCYGTFESSGPVFDEICSQCPWMDECSIKTLEENQPSVDDVEVKQTPTKKVQQINKEEIKVCVDDNTVIIIQIKNCEITIKLNKEENSNE